MRQRLLTAFFLIPIALSVLYLGGVYLTATFLLVFCAINYEFYAVVTRFSPVALIKVVLFHLLLPFSYLCFGLEGLFICLLCCFLVWVVVLILYVESEPHQPDIERLVPFIMFGLLYVGVLPTVLVAYSVHPMASELFSWLIAVSVATDSFAFFTGKFFGGQKLSERISPNKTCSGALGGLFAGVVFGALLGNYLFEDISLLEFSVLSAVCSIFVQFGDLFESLFKASCWGKGLGGTTAWAWGCVGSS